MKQHIFILLLVAGFISCQNSGTKNKHSEQKTIAKTEVKYAELFSITTFENYTEISVINPWNKNEIYGQYILIAKGSESSTDLTTLPEDAVIIETPIDNLALLATPYIGYIEKLNALDKITGIANGEYVYNENVRSNIKNGHIAIVGKNADINLEMLIDVDADVIIGSGFQTKNKSLELAEKSGLDIVYFVEWMEQSPLARAEWIKVAGALLGKEKEAEVIFKEIESQYLKVTNLAASQDQKPSVMLAKPWSGTWNMPGGKSYMAHYLRDAGAAYHWFSDTTSGSIPLSFEEVIDQQMNTDIWINPGQATSISQILEDDERYAIFKPTQTGEIYGYNHKKNKDGINAYWEIGSVNPHLILSDLIKIFHPDLMPDYAFYFYEKLEK